MNFFHRILIRLWNFLRVLWFPLLLLVVFLFALVRFSGIQNAETARVVLGVMLGVGLGFLADILKRSLDEYFRLENLKKSAFKLLKEDAKGMFRTIEVYKSAWDSRASAPEEARTAMESSLPLRFEFRYWDRFNKDNDFLLLGSEAPFNKIFSEFWEYEKILKLIDQAKAEKNNQAGMMAVVMYRETMEKGHHKDFLKLFMDQEEFENYEKNWRNIK